MPQLPYLASPLLTVWTGVNVIGLLVIALLVTRWLRDREALARAQDEIDQSLALTQAALEASPAAVLIMDRDQTVITCSQTFIELWGLPDGWGQITDPEERIQYQAFQLKDPQGYYRRTAQLWQDLDQVGCDLLEFRDGRIIERQSLPFQINGETHGRLFAYQDITARKGAEAQIQALLNQQRERVTRLENLRTAAANVSIEINVPGVLKSILLNAASLLDASACELYLASPERCEAFFATRCAGPQPPNTGLQFTPAALKDRVMQSGRGALAAGADPTLARSLVTVPLLKQRSAIGLITVVETGRSAPYNADDLQVLELFAQQTAITLLNAQLFEEVNRLATIDPLTGLYNRRQWLNLAQQELERSLRYGTPFSVIMFDIDHFKQVNDTYGHPVGDQVLHWLAEKCLGQLRHTDVLGRCGGEEFLVVLPHTALLEGVLAAERLRARIAREAFMVADSRPLATSIPLPITISLGVAAWDPSLGDLDRLLALADQAMYHSKQSGRNQVTGIDAVSGEILPSIVTPVL